MLLDLSKPMKTTRFSAFILSLTTFSQIMWIILIIRSHLFRGICFFTLFIYEYKFIFVWIKCCLMFDFRWFFKLSDVLSRLQTTTQSDEGKPRVIHQISPKKQTDFKTSASYPQKICRKSPVFPMLSPASARSENQKVFPNGDIGDKWSLSRNLSRNHPCR